MLTVVPSPDVLLHSSILKSSLSTCDSRLSGTHTPVLSCIWPLIAAGYKHADESTGAENRGLTPAKKYFMVHHSFLNLSTQLAVYYYLTKLKQSKDSYLCRCISAAVSTSLRVARPCINYSSQNRGNMR